MNLHSILLILFMILNYEDMAVIFFFFVVNQLNCSILNAAYLDNVTRSTLHIKYKWSNVKRFSSAGKYFISMGYAKLRNSDVFLSVTHTIKWWYVEVIIRVWTTYHMINLVFYAEIDYGSYLWQIWLNKRQSFVKATLTNLAEWL